MASTKASPATGQSPSSRYPSSPKPPPTQPGTEAQPHESTTAHLASQVAELSCSLRQRLGLLHEQISQSNSAQPETINSVGLNGTLGDTVEVLRDAHQLLTYLGRYLGYKT